MPQSRARSTTHRQGRHRHSDIPVEGRLRTRYWVWRRRVARTLTDVRSQQKAARLAAALKENLKRRKAQARGRKAATSVGEEVQPGPPAPERDKPSD